MSDLVPSRKCNCGHCSYCHSIEAKALERTKQADFDELVGRIKTKFVTPDDLEDSGFITTEDLLDAGKSIHNVVRDDLFQRIKSFEEERRRDNKELRELISSISKDGDLESLLTLAERLRSEVNSKLEIR